MTDPQNWKRDETPKSFSNPLGYDVTFAYQNDDNQTEHITLLAFQVSTYPKYLADWLIKHLLDAIIEDRNMGYVTPDDLRELRSEVEL